MERQAAVTLCAVGDVLVNRDDPDSAFALSAPMTREADISFCQLEAMYSVRGTGTNISALPQRPDPKNISAFPFAGFDIASLAGNHAMDWGPDGLADTIELLGRHNIRTVGAGKNLAEARKPVTIEKHGLRVAFLAYNSILPHPSVAAGPDTPGCAAIKVSTVYEPVERGQPGCPARILTTPDESDVAMMKGDIAEARKSADVVLLSLHWGVHFIPAVLANYQREVGHAAIDAGADLIIGTHPHILKAIEVYKGKVITYSLGNFIFDLHLTAKDFESPRRQELLKVYPERKIYDDYPTYPFPVDARKTIALKARISKSGVEQVSFRPLYITPTGQPEVLNRDDPRSMGVFNYMNDLSAEFNTKLSFEGDEVLIHTNR